LKKFTIVLEVFYFIPTIL